MDISSVKSAKFHTRERRYGYERIIFGEKLNFFIVSQNNGIKTDHIEMNINNTPQNSKYRLNEDRNERINDIISEYSKLTQKKYMPGWKRLSTGN